MATTLHQPGAPRLQTRAVALQQWGKEMNRILEKSLLEGTLTPFVQTDRIGIIEVALLHASDQASLNEWRQRTFKQRFLENAVHLLAPLL